MKKIFTLLALTGSCAAFAQTTSVNWMATDCDGTSHTLYSELEAGNIIVVSWVMPCPSCVGPSTAAYNAVQSFASSHPGKVKYYIVDDYGNSSCSAVSSWTTNESVGNISNITFFDNAGDVISMTDYGTAGMPKVVVMGGNDHKIYYNENNSAANNQAAITSAITTALNTTNVPGTPGKVKFEVVPMQGGLAVRCSEKIKKVFVFNMEGKTGTVMDYPKPMTNPTVEIANMADGVYVVQITDVQGNTGMVKYMHRN